MVERTLERAPRVSASVEVGDMASSRPRLYLYADVLAELDYAACYRDGGVRAALVGRRARDERGEFAEISGYAQLSYVADDMVGARDPSAWEVVVREAGGDVVGLFVARDGGQAQLEDEEMVAFVTLGELAGVAIVVLDATNRRLGCYVRPADSQRFINSGFSVVHALEASPRGQQSPTYLQEEE